MAEQEPSVENLPKAVRGGVDKLQQKVADAQGELAKEQARLQKKIERAEAAATKAQVDLARQAAFGAFDVVVPQEGEVSYAEYIAQRPARPTEGIVRNGNHFYDVGEGKTASAQAYENQRNAWGEQQAHYDRVMEKQELEGKSIMFLAREAAKARQDGDATREQDIRDLASKQISEIIHSNEGGDLELRRQEEMDHFDELIEAIPARLEMLAERRAAHAKEQVTDAHVKPAGEGQPSKRKKAETGASTAEQSEKGDVETYLGDELVEVKNKFTSPGGETVVEVVGADGKTSFVRESELTEKEVESPVKSPEKEGRLILSDIVREGAVERWREKLQGDGSEEESEGSEVKADKPEKKAKKASDTKEGDKPKEADTPEKKSEKKPFVAGNFYKDKRVTLLHVIQYGGGPERVEVVDEDGNKYDIPSTLLEYRDKEPEVEPKVPGKELELFTGPSDAEKIAKTGSLDGEASDSFSPKFPGKEVALIDEKPNDTSDGSEATTSPARFAVSADGQVEDEHSEFGFLAEHVVSVEERERQESSVKGWWKNFGKGLREKAGTAYWSARWSTAQSKRLERNIEEGATDAEVQAKREGNRYIWVAAGLGTAVVAVVGALLVAKGLSSGGGGSTGIGLGEHLDWTKQQAGIGGEPTPTPTPSPTVENLPVVGFDGTTVEEIENQ